MSSFDQHLKLHVIYEITCSGCNFAYVGETARHMTLRMTDHQKNLSPVGQHVNEKCGTSRAFNGCIIDQCFVPHILMTLEAQQRAKKKSMLNTRDEYRSQELTMKY